MFLSGRSLKPEILDVERPPPDRLERIYGFLAFVNAVFGGVGAFRRELAGETGPLKILDVGTGSADVPRAIAGWGPHRIVGLDREPDTIRLARRASAGVPGIQFVQADALMLPFASGSFDYVISNLFFHHLPDDVAVRMLKEFDRIASKGVIVNDLRRRVRLYLWTWLFTRFADPIVRYDGPLSVRKAFTLKEAEELVRRSGVGYLKVRGSFGHRWIISGRK